MVLSLIYGKKYPKTKIGTIELDATLLEEHSYSSKVTSFPVDRGVNDGFEIVSDHIIKDPDRLTIQGVVSDTPLNILSQFNRSIDAFNSLVRLHETREVISVVTGLKVYTQMVITNLTIPRNLRTGQSLTFNIELQRILFDTSVRLELDRGTPFGGVQDKIPSEIVASNEDIPILMFDPEGSLKDQASSGIDIGQQSLDSVPTASIAKVTSGVLNILGVA